MSSATLTRLHIPHPGYQPKEVRDMLALFGPYLAYRPLVYCPGRNRYGRLLGLPHVQPGDAPRADVLLFQTEAERREEVLFDFAEPITSLLPVLRGFEDLPEPLPNGTVPAVEIAKLLPYAHKFNWEEVTATLHRVGRVPFIEVGSPHTSILTMYDGDYGFEETYFNVALRVTDYLRQNLFAVGLKPEQYHRNAELLRLSEI
jgi:hypothetical protein